MSKIADIRSTLSGKKIREKLTLEERAELLWELTEDLDWDTYSRFGESGCYLGSDIPKAMEDLKRTDDEAMKYGW
jgi:hypothetical protein